MGLVDDIKNQVKKSGTNKGKFLYFKSGTKIRVRFLDDMDAGHKIKFHDSFASGVNVPCQEVFGNECPYCDDDELRTRDQYAWAVWDYEAKEVKLLMAPVNQCSPVPALVSLYEAYGSIADRDYVITKSGAQQSTTYSVVPMDKAKFRNDKAKAFSESKFLDLLTKAFPLDADEDEPKKGVKKAKKQEPEDDFEDEEDEDVVDYAEMTAKELFLLCKEREINAKPKLAEAAYIKLLKKWDAEQEAEDEEDDEDEWDS